MSSYYTKTINGYALKPCPFCGSTNVHCEELLETSSWGEEIVVDAYVECYNCLSMYKQAESTNWNDLTDAWNKRCNDGTRP